MAEKGLSSIFLIALVVITAFAIFGAYQFGNFLVSAENPPTAKESPNQNSQSVLKPADSPDTEISLETYVDPENKYSIKYPKDWKITPPNPLPYLSVTSPNYDNSGINPSLLAGAEISIYSKKADFQTIAEEFNKDGLGQDLAKNLKKLKVDRQDAIQYDYSRESVTATNTRFIKNGVSYLIKLQYVDEAGKNAVWNIYSDLLNSFKAQGNFKPLVHL